MSPERLVVVGHGMAATRLVEQLVDGRYDGQVTVLGDEPVPAYNRILLSAVLEGTHADSAITLRRAEWYAEHGVDLRLGSRVLAIDREHRDVMLVDGTVVPFDRLVLATGSLPTLPPVRGLVTPEGRLHPAVHAFRSLADCERLLGAVPGARRAVVVGGGLLGLQVARALSVRGVATEVVEGTEHLLSRQVGAGAGAVLARSLRRLGTTVYTGARAVRLVEPTSGEGVTGVRLDNGVVLDTDLVVLTAGGRPATSLARAAGLAVRRGVVVDDHLTSPTDPAVHAIGDCAEHRGATTGFVPPAWDQATVLARRLCGDDVEHAGSRGVARLRATGLDVAVLGDPVGAEGEVVEVTNPVVGKHSRLVVRDGVVVAAALVGDLSRVGLITQHYDRGTVLGPHEPGQLLLPEQGAAAPTAVALPDDVEVCACAGVSAGRLRACADLAQAREQTRATTGCGSCTATCAQLVGTAAADPACEVVRTK
ncbi:NAD(P)H-nitrite reductase large subunit [Nocardioides marinisabuli]|uniref:NAD(P)H-nitrite reductase large subunit n=1 Tax=Nocardioides marinisabuli TaxID=419476 RepID=A0A7Y9JPS9_9ACTN|nr:FAD-dependent oxidoreductase [Nocardioides marinisabuli]NYD57352.1 NAD(P)H-nitrite reductase large subunit [Nocardioides marinisabuli]